MFSIARTTGRQSTRALRAGMIAPIGLRGLAYATGLLDVTREIKVDHDNVSELWERYKASPGGEEKRMIANTLVREMAIHGDAEEVSLYNDYDRLGLKDTAVHNKDEHADIKMLVFRAEHVSAGDPRFDYVITEAVEAFLLHAQEEEVLQHPTIREMLSPEDNDKIARAFLKARETVPSRPHPLSPQTGGPLQRAMGAQSRVQDKVVEKVMGRKYVDLKHEHPRL